MGKMLRKRNRRAGSLFGRILSPPTALYRPLLLALLAAGFASVVLAQMPKPEFISLESAKPVLQKMTTGDGAHPSASVSAQDWTAWLKKSDSQVRQRLDTGEEDSLTNLLRFGVTYTKEYRIDDDYLVALWTEQPGEFLRREPRQRSHQGAGCTQGQSGLRRDARLGREERLLPRHSCGAKEVESVSAGQPGPHAEGISAGAVAGQGQSQPDVRAPRHLARQQPLARLRSRPHLQSLLSYGKLQPNSIRRVAIVGPGLDFVNKQEGVDYYPPQITQPFAVLDTLFRLGLAKPDAVEIYTFDISSRVNLHLDTARKNAALGQPTPCNCRGTPKAAGPTTFAASSALLATTGSADRATGRGHSCTTTLARLCNPRGQNPPGPSSKSLRRST